MNEIMIYSIFWIFIDSNSRCCLFLFCKKKANNNDNNDILLQNEGLKKK